MSSMTLREAVDRARTAFRMGDHELVESLLVRVIATRPDYHPAYNMLGIALERRGNHARARSYLEQAIRVRPDYAEAHNNLGIVYREMGRYDEALAEFRRALELGMERADLYYNLGNVYKRIEEYPNALTQYRTAISVDPTFTPPYNNLGTVLETLGRPKEAAAAYRQGLQVDPNQPRLHYNLGVVLGRLGQHEAARREFEAAARSRPGWVDALNNLGVVSHRLGRVADAQRRFREVLRIDPRNVHARNNLGIAYRELGRREDAAAQFREALRADPRFTAAGLNLAGVLEEDGFTSEALQVYERLVEVDPRDPDLRYRLGLALGSLDRKDEAVEQLEQAHELRADHAGTLRALGAAYQAAGNPARAAQAYARLAEVDPGNVDIHYDLALLHRDADRQKAAESEVKQFLERHPDHVGAKLLLGDIYIRQKQYRHASQVFSEILEREPHNSAAHSMLAAAARALGDPGGAIQSFERLITLQGTTGDPSGLGEIPETLDRYEEAVADYERRHRQEWSRSLRALRDRGVESQVIDQPGTPGLAPSTDSPEEDAVPIINIGGHTPALAVEEEEEDLSLTEAEAEREAAERATDIADEHPPSLMNLLHGQELYEPDAAWRPFRGLGAGGGAPEDSGRPPAPPGGAPQPAPQRPDDYAPPAAPPYAGPAPAAAPAPAPQAQQAFFPAYAPPPYQPPPSPLPLYPPSSLPSPAGGAPASAPPTYLPPASGPTRSPEAAAAPQPYPESRPPTPQPGPAPEPGPAETGTRGVVMEEATEDIWEGAEPEPAAEEARVGTDPAAAMPPEPPPEPESGAPGMAQAPTEEPPDLTPAAEEPDLPPTAGDARKELHDYLAKVKGALDRDRRSDDRGGPATQQRAPGLLDYLGKLADHLPDEARSRFQESDERLRMEVLKSKLFGRRGLRERAVGQQPQDAGPGAAPSAPGIADTVGYMKDLAGHILDSGLRRNVMGRLDRLLGKLRSDKDG